MKKYTFSLPALLFLLGFWGCEKDYDNLIDNSDTAYQVSSLSSFTEISYGLQDSVQTLNIAFLNDDGVTGVSSQILTPDGEEISGSPVILMDNGNLDNNDTVANDNVYSARFTLKQEFINGKYLINYFVTDNNNLSKLVGTHTFNYDNGQTNVPPVLHNLVAPDTVAINPEEPTPLFISVDVTDNNGINDIKQVFFNSFIPPNGDPSSRNPFIMLDNGDLKNGDNVANDGTYSIIVELPRSGVTPGVYRWEFQAQDRRNLFSEKIIHNITIK